MQLENPETMFTVTPAEILEFVEAQNLTPNQSKGIDLLMKAADTIDNLHEYIIQLEMRLNDNADTTGDAEIEKINTAPTDTANQTAQVDLNDYNLAKTSQYILASVLQQFNLTESMIGLSRDEAVNAITNYISVLNNQAEQHRTISAAWQKVLGALDLMGGYALFSEEELANQAVTLISKLNQSKMCVNELANKFNLTQGTINLGEAVIDIVENLVTTRDQLLENSDKTFEGQTYQQDLIQSIAPSNQTSELYQIAWALKGYGNDVGKAWILNASQVLFNAAAELDDLRSQQPDAAF